MLKSSQIFLLSLCFILLGDEVLAQKTANLDALLRTPGMEGASVGLSIKRLDDGNEVMSYDSERLLIPASTMKAITTLTTLKQFGVDHSFETELMLDGNMGSNGTWLGDLIVRGKGDPSFLSKHFYDEPEKLIADWVEVLKKRGINGIKGRIIVLDDYFSGYPVANGVIAEDVGNYYGGAAHGFNCYDNTYELEFQTGESGNRARFNRYHGIDSELVFKSEVTAGYNNKDEAYVMSLPYGNDVFIKGTLPANKDSYKIKAAYPDPSRAFALHLNAQFNKNGIKFIGEVTSARTHKFRTTPEVLDTHGSPNLMDLIRHTNTKSDNLYANALYRHCGLALNGNGDMANSGAQILNYWSKNGVSTKGQSMNDGAGLSRTNLLSTNFMSSVLSKAKPEEREILISGFDKQDLGTSTVYYKTGYMDGVRCLTGFINKEGKWYSFSFMVNHHKAATSIIHAQMLKALKSF